MLRSYEKKYLTVLIVGSANRSEMVPPKFYFIYKMRAMPPAFVLNWLHDIVAHLNLFSYGMSSWSLFRVKASSTVLWCLKSYSKKEEEEENYTKAPGPRSNSSRNILTYSGALFLSWRKKVDWKPHVAINCVYICELPFISLHMFIF